MIQNNNAPDHNIHWHLSMLDGLDVGLIALDRDFKIELWNTFVTNHSGVSSTAALGKNLFDLFESARRPWVLQKINSAFTIGHRVFITWRETNYVIPFKPERPVTCAAQFMYQNVTIIPIYSPKGEVERVLLVIYDVTDFALAHLGLRHANQQLERLSRIDALTDIFNRAHWEELVVVEFQRLQRSHGAGTLIMLDIDHFKRINDTFGHQAGDQVIRALADLLRQQCRGTDFCGRYGGEEFGVVLVDTDKNNATIFAERLRSAAQGLTVYHDTYQISFTISLGLAQKSAAFSSHEEWIQAADKALYRSKETGRNRYSTY